MLYNKLKNHNRIPFHMPGHKRNTELLGENLPYFLDITEIDGFDNLHNPQNIIADIEKKISKLYNSDHSFISVNGSTCGILTAIYTLADENSTVLLSRNCHKSVYNGIKLTKAKTKYLEPIINEYGIVDKIDIDEVKNAIDQNEINLIVITSPTYEGIISDVNSICKIAHSKEIPVIVDAAHGAHIFDKLNADVVIMSLHKTLPALTQCAIINVNGNLVDAEQFRINLSIFETSSPSYILMSSVEKCIDFISENRKLINIHKSYMQTFYDKLKSLKYLKALVYDDQGKIVIFTGNSSITSSALAERLRNIYNIEVEMVSKDYILAMSTICDSEENLDSLAESLIEIDSELSYKDYKAISICNIPPKYCEAHDTAKGDYTKFKDCVDKISTEYIWTYPPGIPLVVPGEIITDEIIRYIYDCIENGIEVYSTYRKMPYGLYCKI